MRYTIIEDCSPYYVRFTFEGLDKIVQFIKEHDHLVHLHNKFIGYSHLDFHEDIALQIMDMLPMSNLVPFNKERVAIFETPPGGGCGIHKDGMWSLTSFNIIIETHDELCETTFYSDIEMRHSQPTGMPYVRHIFSDYNKLAMFKPIKSMVAKEGEMILFNPNIWHAWQNIKSPYKRRVVTLRLVDPSAVTFDEMKNKLFT
jgi:hypothetical protein